VQDVYANLEKLFRHSVISEAILMIPTEIMQDLLYDRLFVNWSPVPGFARRNPVKAGFATRRMVADLSHPETDLHKM
jgi:hypothetical protein